MRLENMNISFTQLWYFVHIVESGSFARASRYLNVTPSTLSKSIQSLEKNIEIQLFVRDGNNLSVTAAGKFLYIRWKAVLSDMERSFLMARKYPGGTRRSIRLGTLDSHRSEAFLLDYTARFYEVCPDCDIELERIPTDLLRKKLLDHELDAAFTVRYEIDYGYWPDCETRLFRECPHSVCMLPSNPLAKKDTVTVRDLASMNLVVISALYLPTYNQMLQDLFAAEGLEPNIVYNTANASSQVYHLHDKNDVFLCDRYHRDYGLDHLLYKPISGTRSGVVMVWNRDSRSRELDALLALFQ